MYSGYRGAISIIAIFFVLIFTSYIPLYIDESEPKESEGVAEVGKKLFVEKGCIGCHTIGGGKLSGPDLKGVTERREEQWLRRWIKAPDEMVYTDPIAKELLMEYYVPMPNQGLSDDEVEALLKYLKLLDSQDSQNSDKLEETNKGGSEND